MSHWVRLYDDMPNDPKWRVVARRSGRPVSEVVSVFVHMLTNAGASEHRGCLSGWSDEDVSMAIDAEVEHVAAIRAAMEGKTLDGDRLTGWDKRQRDSSTERVQKWRDRKAAESTGIDVSESEEAKKKRLPDAGAADNRAVRRAAFERFWLAYPHKVGKPTAEKSFVAQFEHLKGDASAIMDGLEYYKGSKPAERSWLNPSTFLNQRRFNDRPDGDTVDAKYKLGRDYSARDLSRASGDVALAVRIAKGVAR